MYFKVRLFYGNVRSFYFNVRYSYFNVRYFYYNVRYFYLNDISITLSCHVSNLVFPGLYSSPILHTSGFISNILNLRRRRNINLITLIYAIKGAVIININLITLIYAIKGAVNVNINIITLIYAPLKGAVARVVNRFCKRSLNDRFLFRFQK